MCPQVHLIVQNQNSTANKNYRKQQKFGAAKVWRNCIAFSKNFGKFLSIIPANVRF